MALCMQGYYGTYDQYLSSDSSQVSLLNDGCAEAKLAYVVKSTTGWPLCKDGGSGAQVAPLLAGAPWPVLRYPAYEGTCTKLTSLPASSSP